MKHLDIANDIRVPNARPTPLEKPPILSLARASEHVIRNDGTRWRVLLSALLNSATLDLFALTP